MKYELVEFTRGKVLEIGSDGRRTFPHFITVDEGWGNNWKPDIVSMLNELTVIASSSIDAVYAKNIIEHYEDKAKAIKEWWRVLKQDGFLILYFKGDQKEVIDVMKGGSSWDLVVSEPRDECFFQVYKKGGKGHRFSYAKEKPEKTCGIFRHGGFGDMIQMSPILPVLKEQGYHIVVYCSPYAYLVAKNDPNIDEFILQDKDQVPNNELGPFWEYLREKHDKFINLSESVEGSLLAMPDRAQFNWGKAALDAYMSHNYHEFTHLIADVPQKYPPKYYETEKEKRWALKQRNRIGGRLVMWVMAGSSVHKVYPWMDSVIAKFLLDTEDVKFVFVGGPDCDYLEEPWRDEKRVVRMSGKCSIGETMALAKMCDVVVGPETGVMNAVSHETTPKVIALSHSSPENLTKHWINCVSIQAENCPCHPCHRMIYGFVNCSRGPETGVALCQENISPERMYNAIAGQLNGDI